MTPNLINKEIYFHNKQEESTVEANRLNLYGSKLNKIMEKYEQKILSQNF